MNMETRPQAKPGKRRKVGAASGSPVSPQAAAPVAVAQGPAAGASPGTPAVRAPQTPWILQVWARLRREPTLMLTVGYLGVSFLGLWASYWFFRGFGLPILQYMQPSDFLVAGLREPTYALLLFVSVSIAWLISWPETYRAKYPARVEELRRRWWGRQLFPESRWFRWKLFGASPETGIAVAAACYMVWVSAFYVQQRGENIRAGSVRADVVVTRSEGGPVRQARLLGTSSSFVFVWWPDARVAEAIPIETVQGLVSKPADEPAGKPAASPEAASPPMGTAAAATAGASSGASADAMQGR
ncbi:hypothetical protein [Agrilutibacter solisilvae]|uniref:Uncharacterized protein n=1 Tax=Agrilutibacter solisilvae TaxID=2763317 RepID=A0A974XY46_9GAMM|nr:hypothetical protein [Lysobacter solisilvae]QSX77090.1 hypothetical protein I8J32_009750 [Lysobacter solisilvae]